MFEMMRAIAIDPAAATARGRAHVSEDHRMFADHFPGAPVLPGTTAVELAAQVAGPLAEEVVAARHGVERWAVLGMIRSAKFLAPCPLPATVDVRAEVTRADPACVTIRVEAAAQDACTLRAELAMMMVEASAAWGSAIDARRARVAAWKAAWRAEAG